METIMSFTKFTVEGEAILGYHADVFSDRDRGVRMVSDESGEETSLEAMIARSLEFPSDNEFDQFHQRMDELRKQDLQPAGDQPDITREGTRLRITVEVIDGDDG
jgi:hypothetical protein